MSGAASLDLWPTVMFIGDSLTEFGFSTEGRWLARVADRLRRRCDLRVRGFSGYTTRWWRAALPLLVPEDAARGSRDGRCAACVLFLGANDSSRGAASPTLHVPLAEFQENMECILEQLMLRLNIRPHQILLINIPPVDEVAYARDCETTGFPFDKYLADCQNYNAALQDVAERRGVEVVDIYNRILGRKDWQQLFVDGIHFNASGSDLVFDCVWPAIERRVCSLPLLLPDFETAAVLGFDAALGSWRQQNGFST